LLASFSHGTWTATRKARARLGPQVMRGVRRTPVKRALFFALSSVLLAPVVACSPIPEPSPCRVFRLNVVEPHEVLSTYGPSIFSASCPTGTPQTILVKEPGYTIYVYLMANQDPKLFMGVQPAKAYRLEPGPGFATIPSGSAIDPRATHWVRSSALTSSTLEFRVVDVDNGNIHKYSYALSEVDCTCKEYNGL
jgi:hypothetical protein